MFESKQEALEYVPDYCLIAIKISLYQISESDAKTALLTQKLNINPIVIWYYSWNEVQKRMDLVISK